MSLQIGFIRSPPYHRSMSLILLQPTKQNKVLIRLQFYSNRNLNKTEKIALIFTCDGPGTAGTSLVVSFLAGCSWSTKCWFELEMSGLE